MPKGLKGFQKGHGPLWKVKPVPPSRKGAKQSDDARRKMSESKKLIPLPQWFKKGVKPWQEHPRGMLGKKHSDEWKRLQSERNRGHKFLVGRFGELANAWKGGNCIKKDERNDSAYQNFVRQTKRRDHYKCRIENEHCRGYLTVHHILSWRDFPELRYEINNGITLCQAHHPLKRAEEKQLIPVFQGLVEVSNGII